MTPDLDIRVAQLRDQYDRLGQALADLVRDAYAQGRATGLTEAAAVDDVALRRPTAV